MLSGLKMAVWLSVSKFSYSSHLNAIETLREINNRGEGLPRIRKIQARLGAGQNSVVQHLVEC